MARTLSTDAAAVLANPNHRGKIVAFSVYATDETTITVDLTERVLDFSMSEDADGPRTAEATLFRQVGLYNLSPLIIPENFNHSGAAYLRIAGRVVVTMTMEPDSDSGSRFTDNLVVFDGYIDEIDWSGEDTVRLQLTDRTAKLRDTWIETERVYAFAQGVNATKGCLIWKNNLAPIVLNELVIPSDAKRNGHYYKATTVSSAQGTTEPAWPTGSGSTVVSGGVTFTEAGSTSPTTGTAIETIIPQILADNGLGSHCTLRVPASPSWNVKPFLQERQSVFEALTSMATQLGWTLRFDWWSAASKFDLVLKEPARTSGSAVRTYTADYLHDISKAAIDVFRIRNAIRVTFGDSSALTAEQRPTRKVVDRTDSTSITKYGRRFAEVQEADASSIDTTTEAQRMADAMLADLKEPLADVEVTSPFDPYLELGDRVTVPADGLHWTAAQTLAITTLRWSATADGWTTKIGLRGAPVAGVQKWLDREGRADKLDVHKISLLQQLGTPQLTITPGVGGANIDITGMAIAKNAQALGHEFHVGEPGFTPSASSLVATGQQTTVNVSDLVGGKAYEAIILPYTQNADRVVLGEASSRYSFTAGRAKAGHYDSSATQSHLPLNGNFEHASDDLASFPPDHWELSTLPAESAETWGSSGSVYYGTDTNKGRYIALRAHASKRGSLLSSAFEVRRGCQNLNIYLSIRRQVGSGTGAPYELLLDVLGYSDAALGTLVINTTIPLSGSWSGPYPSLNTWYDAVVDFGATYGPIPSNVNFLQVRVRRSTTGSTSVSWEVGDVYVQEADFERAQIRQEPWIDTSVFFNTNWQNYGGGFHGVEHFRDSFGIVHLRGLIQTTVARAAGVTAFTLGSGYQPVNQQLFTQSTGGAGGYCRVDISNAGAVIIGPALAANDWVSFDGIHFDTR